MIERLRAEFVEMPGLRLNVRQVQRLCGIDTLTCQDLLGALVDMKFLRKNPDGTYGRLTDGNSGLVPTEKATIGTTGRRRHAS